MMYLVVGLVPVLDAEVEGVELHVEVGLEELLLDEVPDDAGHLVAEHLDEGAGLDSHGGGVRVQLEQKNESEDALGFTV